jgi:hypothetical protein
MKPLILDHAIERNREKKTLFNYDFDESLNTFILNNEKKAVIDSTHEEITLLTKTKQQMESDDEGLNLFELNTITRVLKESDDNCYSFNSEIITHVARERDDESFNHYE